MLLAGRVNRADLIRHFDISMPQASADISRHLDRAPHRARYDRNEKSYLVAPAFAPLFSARKPIDILDELRTSQGAPQEDRPPWAAEVPVESAVPRTERIMDIFILSALLSAVRERKMVQIEYQSFGRSQP